MIKLSNVIDKMFVTRIPGHDDWHHFSVTDVIYMPTKRYVIEWYRPDWDYDYEMSGRPLEEAVTEEKLVNLLKISQQA